MKKQPVFNQGRNFLTSYNKILQNNLTHLPHSSSMKNCLSGKIMDKKISKIEDEENNHNKLSVSTLSQKNEKKFSTDGNNHQIKTIEQKMSRAFLLSENKKNNENINDSNKIINVNTNFIVNNNKIKNSNNIIINRPISALKSINPKNLQIKSKTIDSTIEKIMPKLNQPKDKEKENSLFPNLNSTNIRNSNIKASITDIHTINPTKLINFSIQHSLPINHKKKRPFSSRHLIQNETLFCNKMNIKKKKEIDAKKVNIGNNSNRPSTGYRLNLNSQIMNININFYNIDVNKRFLAPQVNPLYSGNELNVNDNIRNFSNEKINLKNYKNTNEFFFQKIMKAVEEVNCNKKLTINDLN